MHTLSVLKFAGCLTVVGLVLASCAPAATPSKPVQRSATSPAEAPTAKPAAPPPKVETPAAKPAASPAAPSPTPKPAAEQPRYGGILNVAHHADPASYDPIQEVSTQHLAPVIPNYSGIVQHDPLEPTKVIGDLAESWASSPDGMSYTFNLYKNVKWHDGAPFTSEDARFTLEMVRTPPKGIVSPRQEWLKAVDKIEAPDRDTLRMTLKYPSASFIHNLGDGRMVIIPKHAFETKGNMKKDVVGTGPYKVKSFTPGSSYSIAKNPDYFIKGRPYLDGITWYIIPDVATRFAALRTQRAHIYGFGSTALSPSQIEVLRRELPGKVVVQRFGGLIFQGMWMLQTKAPWNDIRVRRAVELTLDRNKLIQVAVQGLADVGGFMPPGTWSLPEAELMKMPGYREPRDADIAEAKRLMAEAGYAQGFKTTGITRPQSNFQANMVSAKEQLAKIGIEIEISLMDQGALMDRVYKGNYDMAVQMASAAYDSDSGAKRPHFGTGERLGERSRRWRCAHAAAGICRRVKLSCESHGDNE
ncbi:MAG: ABC transporter substrate-binding protein [Chloroflexi bacterium]|nr:ABC transporter substrate-binding protein [Chloroflexota bacterium]